MAAQRVADMTFEELREFVQDVVDQRLKTWPRPADPRSVREILDSIERNRWTPPPGSPSTLELLREDRER